MVSAGSLSPDRACLTSNTVLGAVSSLDEHSIRRFIGRCHMNDRSNRRNWTNDGSNTYRCSNPAFGLPLALAVAASGARSGLLANVFYWGSTRIGGCTPFGVTVGCPRHRLGGVGVGDASLAVRTTIDPIPTLTPNVQPVPVSFLAHVPFWKVPPHMIRS